MSEPKWFKSKGRVVAKVELKVEVPMGLIIQVSEKTGMSESQVLRRILQAMPSPFEEHVCALVQEQIQFVPRETIKMELEDGAVDEAWEEDGATLNETKDEKDERESVLEGARLVRGAAGEIG